MLNFVQGQVEDPELAAGEGENFNHPSTVSRSYGAGRDPRGHREGKD